MKGKREMKRNYTPFVTGMVTMVLIIGLISASFADNSEEQSPNEAVPADIGIGMFLHQQIAPGEMLTTEKGGKAPKVVACKDTKGDTHYYIEVTEAAELFDVTDGVNFHEEANQLEFGAVPRFRRDGEEWNILSPTERQDFDLSVHYNLETGEEILTGGALPVTGSDGTTTTAMRLGFEPEELPEFWATMKEGLKDKPEYGITCGMYTEVDPNEVNLATLSGIDLQEEEFTDPKEIRHFFNFTYRLGKYAVLTIENTSTVEEMVEIYRLNTVGGGMERFTGICLPAGEKMVRAFRIDENKPLMNQLMLRVTPLDFGEVSVKVTNEQYRSGK